MFRPGRGDWDEEWKGWWGEEPPYHGPAFVLTHHAARAADDEGGMTFTFVTDGIESALAQGGATARDANVAIAGGAATVNQYLAAGLLDDLRLHVRRYCLAPGSGCSKVSGTPRSNRLRSCTLASSHI